MSKRISDTYKNFLAYEEMQNKRMQAKKKSELSASEGGLLSRKNSQSQAPASGKLSEVNKVLNYIESIRKYRMS
tara:strand:+ start:158 stop:379 length:222 start_codon:yes stop_codon:yes gene_type:complete